MEAWVFCKKTKKFRMIPSRWRLAWIFLWSQSKQKRMRSNGVIWRFWYPNAVTLKEVTSPWRVTDETGYGHFWFGVVRKSRKGRSCTTFLVFIKPSHVDWGNSRVELGSVALSCRPSSTQKYLYAHPLLSCYYHQHSYGRPNTDALECWWRIRAPVSSWSGFLPVDLCLLLFYQRNFKYLHSQSQGYN